jgi:hypothetical protein
VVCHTYYQKEKGKRKEEIFKINEQISPCVLRVAKEH